MRSSQDIITQAALQRKTRHGGLAFEAEPEVLPWEILGDHERYVTASLLGKFWISALH